MDEPKVTFMEVNMLHFQKQSKIIGSNAEYEYQTWT